LGLPQSSAVLPELPPQVRAELIDVTSRETLAAILLSMDADDLDFVAESVPPDVLEEVRRSRDERSRLEAAASYPDDSVAQLMVQDYLAVAEERNVGQV